MTSRDRRKQSALRFLFANGIPLTSLIAIVYFTGVFVERNENQRVQLAMIQSTQAQTQQQISDVTTTLELIKLRVDRLEHTNGGNHASSR